MDQMTTILLDIQRQLGATIPELAYIDKDWGQLAYDKPAVKFPCALLDVKEITYTQMGKGCQMADTQITVTVASMRLAASSLLAPRQEDAYHVIELLGRIHAALHQFTTGSYSPLFRTNLRKILADSSKECYEIIYQTAYQVGFDTEETSSRISGVEIDIR